MKPYTKQRRYSNLDPSLGIIEPIIPTDPSTGNVYTGSSTTSSSGSTWNWGYLTQIVNSLSGVASSIWGKGGNYQAEAYQSMYNQQKQTNTILWVVIGLVLALGVVLVIRKTK